MTTKLVGLKDFRQNLSAYAKQAESGKFRFIILKKNKPMLEMRSLKMKEFTLENLQKEISQSRKQVKKGRVYSLEEVENEIEE